MRRILTAAFLVFVSLAPAAAQFRDANTAPNVHAVSPIPGVFPADSGSNVIVVPAAPAPETSTSFSVGTWIADLLGGLVAVFGSVIATFLTKWVMAIAKKAGIEATQAMSDRLDGIIENGLHIGALEAKKDLTGKLNVATKNDVVTRAVMYAQDHGADTIKQISGLDVGDPKVIAALQARAAKALANIGPEAVLTTTTTVAAAPVAPAPATAAPPPNGAVPT